MHTIKIDPAITGHAKVQLKTKWHQSKTQQVQKRLPHEVIYDDMQTQRNELLDIEIGQWEAHFEMVKPLRKKKHDLRNRLIEDRLDAINFHTYEAHDTSDLLEDISEDADVDMDDAFASFIG